MNLLLITSKAYSGDTATGRPRTGAGCRRLSLSCIRGIDPLRIDVNRFSQVWSKNRSEQIYIILVGDYVRLTLLWKRWSQTLQNNWAMPSLRSMRTLTDLSWWQNKHVNIDSAEK